MSLVGVKMYITSHIGAYEGCYSTLPLPGTVLFPVVNSDGREYRKISPTGELV